MLAPRGHAGLAAALFHKAPCCARGPAPAAPLLPLFYFLTVPIHLQAFCAYHGSLSRSAGRLDCEKSYWPPCAPPLVHFLMLYIQSSRPEATAQAPCLWGSLASTTWRQEVRRSPDHTCDPFEAGGGRQCGLCTCAGPATRCSRPSEGMGAVGGLQRLVACRCCCRRPAPGLGDQATRDGDHALPLGICGEALTQKNVPGPALRALQRPRRRGGGGAVNGMAAHHALFVLVCALGLYALLHFVGAQAGSSPATSPSPLMFAWGEFGAPERSPPIYQLSALAQWLLITICMCGPACFGMGHAHLAA